MKKGSIRTRLLAGFLIVAFFTAVVGVVGVGGMLAINQNEEILYVLSVNSDYASQLLTNLHQQRAAYRQAIIYVGNRAEREQNVAELERLDTVFRANLEYLQKNAQTDEAKVLLEEIQKVYNDSFVPLRTQLVDTLQETRTREALQIMENMTVPVDLLTEKTTQLLAVADSNSQQTNARDAKTAHTLMIVVAVLALGSVGIAVFLGVYNSNGIARPVQKVARPAEKISLGDVEVDLDLDAAGDEMKVLAQAFVKMVEHIGQQAEVLDAMAGGDYQVSIPIRSDRDIMNRSINYLISSNNKMLGRIRAASDEVSNGSAQIAQGAQSLATGSSEQAVSIEEFSVTLKDVLDQTESNAASAERALGVTTKVEQLMEESSHSMTEMQQAMHSINESSQNVSRIIKVIEDIAFQTNILALNAAVEAARAGQHGKGFAVVADEVRNLASKSAAAAQETSALIAGSTQRVNEGNKIVEKTGVSLTAVGQYSAESLQLMGEIAESCAQQTQAISEINLGVEQISRVVQANSSTAEESAAAAEEMSSQSTMLKDIVSQFKLQGMDHNHNSTVASSLTKADDSPVLSDAFAISQSDKY